MAEELNQNKDPIKEEGLRLIRVYLEDFSKHIAGDNLAEILLKGHLLVETYLDHAMLFIFDREAKVRSKSFYTKVNDLKPKNCFNNHSVAIECLFQLNKARNDLAHDLNFSITLPQIDEIGYPLGRKYIMRRYAKDLDHKKLLIWVIGEIISMVYYPIWNSLLDEERKKISSGKDGLKSSVLAPKEPDRDAPKRDTQKPEISS